MKGILDKAGLDPADVGEVVFGNVLSAGIGQNLARQVAMGAGIPNSVPASTVNKVCGSSLMAVIAASRGIQCGDAQTVVAGGAENMTRAPFLTSPTPEKKRRPSDEPAVDSMFRDGLCDAYDGSLMGTCGDRCAERYGLTRKEQDDFAVRSYERALDAQREGRFSAEILPVGPVLEDEEPKRFDEEKLRALDPAFDERGTITAGNASSINDGAAAVLVTADRVNASSARIAAYAQAARDPAWFTLAPIDAIRLVLDRAQWSVTDVDLFEINEAFACVPMAAMADLNLTADCVNVNGGAVALGHPIGASGARILATLLHALEARSLSRGVAAICIGGGEAIALAVERSS